MRKSLLLGLLAAVPGCYSPPVGWDSPEPRSRLGAITEAAKAGDRTKIPRLIQSLNHDDPLVRLAAIRTLEQFTGQTLGYDYAAPEWQRRDKIAAWVQWYKQQTPDSPARSAAKPGAGIRPIVGECV